MQVCIETLREEKSHLTSLRDNLECTLENKEKIISKLRTDMEQLKESEQNMDKLNEDNSTLTSRVSDLENQLKNEENENNHLKSKVS